MSRRFPQPVHRRRFGSILRRRANFLRPLFEPLEDRTMLAGGVASQVSPAIVVGRTLSSYFVSDIQNNRETITYTVYNQQADPETGVLLTTTLEPGVTIASASQQPDQSGQNLAWSLGTIQGFDRAGVSLTVNLANPTPLQLDTGAQAYATLDAGAVSKSAPAATLRAGSLFDPGLLASTPDANTTDPFIQEEAAQLDYNPQNIFNFLHDDIGYNSYLGSMRGARGTLWSSAGNALDVASLGVALMRASGIPAQYAQGTLSQSDAQELILSMFPASYHTVGYIPDGAPVSDPANDPQLLSETESHYWFQFQSGSGMQDADPLMAGATIGQTFTTATGMFTQVADDLEAKTQIQLVAEITNTADSLFGLSGGTDTTVLDQTFNDVALVGRPLTIGNLVSTSSIGAVVFSSQTTTYTPYVVVSDEAFGTAQSQVITGQPYQEVQTNFPFGSQVLTGLFLAVTLTGADGTSQTYDRTLMDRIGYAARQGGGRSSVSVNPNGPPAISELDVTTVNVLAGLQDRAIVVPLSEAVSAMQTKQAQLAGQLNGVDLSSPTPAQQPLVDQAVKSLRDLLILATQSETIRYAALSGSDTSQLSASYAVQAYADSPQLIVATNRFLASAANGALQLVLGMDLVSDHVRVIPYPGQANSSTFDFNVARGIDDNVAEAAIMAPSGSQVGVSTVALTLSAADIFTAAVQQGIATIAIGQGNLASLSSLSISDEAKARITAAINSGLVAIVPVQEVVLNGAPQIAWYEVNPQTGETTDASEHGTHGIESLVTYLVGEKLEKIAVAGVSAVYAELLTGITLFSILFPAEFGGWQYRGSDYEQWQEEFKKYKEQILTVSELIAKGTELALAFSGNIVAAGVFKEVYEESIKLAKMAIEVRTGVADPPVFPVLFDPIFLHVGPTDQATQTTAETASLTGGSASGSIQSDSASASGQLQASWQSSAINGFQAVTLASGSASVTNARGQGFGSGTVALATTTSTPISISGSADYTAAGTGSLSFYGPAESSLGVSGNWQNYTTTITGTVAITLTTDGLALNGTTLPAGTYTITTASADLSGSGLTDAPNFAGSVSVNLTGGTIDLGAGTGTAAVGGKPVDPVNGVTLTGYNGMLELSANASGTDSVQVSGSAAGVLAVAASSTSFTTDQNKTITIQTDVQTSLADSYAIKANAPNGWTVAIDSSGIVTATPAPGLQSGIYPIQIIAQSTTNPDLVAQSVIHVTITPTNPGIALAISPDTVFSVPFNGAQLPTAFRATIQNLGPTADTYNLTFSNLPSGFTLLNSGTGVTIPAGQTGIVGLYLVPTGQIAAPGTQESFTVTATSTTDSSITQTQTETFTVPAIDAVTVTSNPAVVNTIPEGAATDTLTITDAGNVPESNITLAATLPGGLTLSGLTPVSVAVGQSATETVTLTPDASTPLNSALDATITATFGPSASPQTQTVDIPVQVVVPGAAAIANASAAANQLGNTSLAAQLNDLSTALTNLVQNPTSAVYSSQAQASLTAVDGLLSADPFLASLIPTLTSDGGALAQATTASAVQTAVSQLGNNLGSVGTTLSDEAAHNFTLSFVTNSQVGRPQLPTTYQVVLRNTGSQTTTYDLGVSGLPGGVTGTLSQPSITLAPGQVTPGSSGVPDVTVTLTSTSATELSPFNFTVTATALGASEITQAIIGSFTVRQALVRVTSVTTNPTFTNPGGQVDVSAQILNAVNQQQAAEVSYTVTNASNNVIFTSQSVATTLNVLTTLTTVDLGKLDTTGFALGQDTITVTVADAGGTPIPGATGTGSLLIGTPVTATLTTTPTTLPAGNDTVTTTLQLNSQTSFTSPLGLVGQATISGSAGVAVDGNLAYVGAPGGIDVVDVSNPSAPSVLSTFGASDFPGKSVGALQVYNNELVVLAQNSSFNSQSLLIYSLATPASPTLLGQTALTFQGNNDSRLGGFSIWNNHVYTFAVWYRYTISSGQIFAQFGETLDVDISNPASPAVAAVIYNDPPDSSTGYPDGTSNVWQSAAVNNDVLLIGSTTATGSTVNGAGVDGIVMVVDTSNPRSPSVLEKLPIPGMAVVTGISVTGNQAFVIGPSQNWMSGTTGFGGNVVVATLDLTNPQSPTVISTQTLNVPAVTLGLVQSLGNNRYVSDGVAGAGNAPGLFVFDASNPQNVVVTQVSVPNFIAVSNYTASGNLLFTVDGSSLSLYNIGQASDIPVTAQVTVPANNGVSIVPGSFNIAPTETTTNPDGSETLAWDLAFSAGNTGQTITWQSSVTGLQPGQSATVAADATVQFTNQGTPGTLTLPDQIVAGDQIIGLAPATQTVAPGAAATCSVTLSNPTSSAVTYSLAVQGVPSGWVNVSSTVLVGAGLTVNVPLVLMSDSFAALGDYGFSVSAGDSTGATGSVSGDLVLQGQPAPPDSNSHGIVAAITPAEATAGQGTSAHFVVQLTNTGSADDTFSLTAAGLPSGVTATFAQTSIDVPPGASNFRDVALTLTPALNTTPGSYHFTVTAASTTKSTVTNAASGTLTVVAGGVEVSLNPSAGAPGSGFEATVTNTGTTTDSFNLALAGPAALVASLGLNSVTLAPGASQVVPISTGAVDFALPGTLNLTAAATSSTNPAVQNADSADLKIPSTQSVTAQFSPASQTLAQPGTATFDLMIQNTGNIQDSYTATIVGTSGPVTATLVGLDGSPAQSIPLFILPGLSGGLIELQTDLSAVGQGTITVAVESLTNGAIIATAMATVGTSVTVATRGPEVTEVQRFGYHMMPTTLVLTFDQALDPATAQDAHNYRIIGPHGRTIRVKSAVYDPRTLTVILHPSRRINIHYRYELIVDGTTAGGLSNTHGQLLDGNDDGIPGSNYRGSITWRNLVLDPPPPKTSHRSKTPAADHRPKSEPAQPAVHRDGLFTRSPSFRR